MAARIIIGTSRKDSKYSCTVLRSDNFEAHLVLDGPPLMCYHQLDDSHCVFVAPNTGPHCCAAVQAFAHEPQHRVFHCQWPIRFRQPIFSKHHLIPALQNNDMCIAVGMSQPE